MPRHALLWCIACVTSAGAFAPAVAPLPLAARASRPPARTLDLRGGAIGAAMAPIGRALSSVPAPAMLGATIVLEIIATTCMKYAATGPAWWYAGVGAGYALCFTVFPYVLRTMPLSVAYAVWSGVGTASATFIGKILFAEPLTRAKLLWTGLIVAGVVGLNFA